MTAQLKDQFDSYEYIDGSSRGAGVVRVPGLYRNIFKRFFDIMAVLCAAPFVLPLVLILALCVRLSGGEAFYRSARVGRGGRVFHMLKLRTMVADADAVLQAYLDKNPEAALEWNTYQKLKKDPRVTPIGRILRKTSFDELPQLWNVVTGDMSLVGPRPMMPDQKVLYPGTAYFDLRPGVTGPWQVSDRNESAFADRARFDQSYYDSLSFSGDVTLLLRTVQVMAKGTGY